jgi:hypothetical protein
MKKLSAEAIIKSYRAVVNERGGVPIGERIFAREGGIPRDNWMGGHWCSWSAFQEAAGFAPNDPTQGIPDEVLLRRFAELALELGLVPTEADLNLKRKADLSFPGKLAFRRWGGRDGLLSAVVEYCEGSPDLEPALQVLKQGNEGNLERRLASLQVRGFVYLLRSGRHFKIGRTNAAGRRVRELAIQLPRKPDTVHVIETDDPEGIEQYWHRRFADKRQGGEWFALSSADVRAFKLRRCQ